MNHEPVVSGAIIDFAQYLALNGYDPQSINHHMNQFAKYRNLDLSKGVGSLSWRNEMLEEPPARSEVQIDLSAVISAVRAEMRNLTVYQGRFHERYPAKGGTVRTEMHEGNAFSTFGVHDLILDLIRRLKVVPEACMDMIFEFELLMKGGAPAMMAVTYGDSRGLTPEEPMRVVFDEYEIVARPTQRQVKDVATAFAEDEARAE